MLYKVIEDKTITWFKNSNEYVIFENTTADILKRIHKGIPIKVIAEAVSKKLSVPLEKSIDFIIDLENQINKSLTKIRPELINDYRDIKKPKTYTYTKYYQINDVIFQVSYLNDLELSYIHPKFAHLEISETKKIHFYYEIFIDSNYIFLYLDNEFVGAWSSREIHFFQGKFSMEIIQKIHKKEEKEWLGVFHASAISNGEKSVLFLGDSGNGKSTSLALLQANGFTCLADDFVPISANEIQVFSFPAAISIKKNSLETLLPIYPELATSAEYNFERLNKVVRYLKPNNDNYKSHLPCRDLIFIKYEKNSELEFNRISKLEAFQQLVPDSWLSPEKENAEQFLNWFENLNCYQLRYSNNEKMINTVHQLFDNEL
ncbi:HPr kinase [Polaribacter dokdonensis DSW-5]|uniref:HPr kinase n=1 Tax=Polaribacter dokdonensis DSW-5 TaxID=1300348 RepID=A0A0M9CEJ4_9FLAO|nr:HPr kinase [Polaribacter dokdonensis DSW-5]SEE22530.1 hypothetical protein SAMN05444353_1293 [Polaribacter dokdonensis DSW-5]